MISIIDNFFSSVYNIFVKQTSFIVGVIILNAKDNGCNDYSFEKLIDSFSSYINHRAKGIKASGLDEDDLEQEGRIALLRAIESFDDAEGADFSVYARVCIDNAMLSAARSAARKKNLPLANYERLDFGAGAEARVSPDEIVVAKDKLSRVVLAASGKLSPLERDALSLNLLGYDYSASAAYLSVSPKAVDNALQRARKKLKQLAES